MRREVSLLITPSFGQALDLDVLSKLVSTLPELFFNEEKSLFETSVGANSNTVASSSHNPSSQTDKMTLSYNSNLYIQMLTNLIDKLCAPLLASIQSRHQRNLRDVSSPTPACPHGVRPCPLLRYIDCGWSTAFPVVNCGQFGAIAAKNQLTSSNQ